MTNIVVFQTNTSVVELCLGELSGIFVGCWMLELVETSFVVNDVSITKSEEEVWRYCGI